MHGLQMSVRCPHCGEECEHRNGRANGSLSVAIVGCSGCRREYEITARMHPFKVGR